MENINHVIYNTGDFIQYKNDATELKNVPVKVQKIAKQAIANGYAVIGDGFALNCVINPEKKVYTATLFGSSPLVDHIPLIKTSGAVNESGAKFVWTRMETLYEQTSIDGIMDKLFKNCRAELGKNTMGTKNVGKETRATCPKVPFICDMIYPTIPYRLDVCIWSGHFTKYLGITILKMLSEKN